MADRQLMKLARVAAAAVALLCTLACAGGAPLRVQHASPEAARRSLRSNVANTGELSDYTRIVLRNRLVAELYADDPVAAIQALHDEVTQGGGGSNEWFALSEVSFQYAEKLEHHAWRRARDRQKRTMGGMVRKAPYYTSDETPTIEKAKAYYRAAALYAYTFLFTQDEDDSITTIDPRLRIAADLYNRAVVETFRNMEGFQVFTGGRFELPFGELVVEFDEMELRWENRLLVAFMPSDEFEIRGLSNRYRRSGFGAPLAARTVPLDPNDPTGYLVARRAVVAANAVLMVDDPREQLQGDEVVARLIITPGAEAGDIEFKNRPLPLEIQPSVALAASLQESDVWQSRLGVFFGRQSRINDDNRLFGWEPRRKGQIPVVFIHGTMSTPVVWANMVNDLQNDPLIRERFQFLFYAYESGNPILYSTMILRRALERAVESFDPAGEDACLRDMVLLGHSQGGLLVKGVTIHSGSKIWDTYFDVPPEETRFNETTVSLMREIAFVDPMPEIGRVVFLSTPHHGSYLASSDILRRLSAWAIQFPGDLAGVAADAAGIAESGETAYRQMKVRTSIDNMSPNNDLIKVIASIPVAPEIPSHSIISVKPGQEIETGDDGVVKYASAHIEEAQSELVVRVSHSSYGYPKTIEEVHRILRLHLEQSTCAEGG